MVFYKEWKKRSCFNTFREVEKRKECKNRNGLALLFHSNWFVSFHRKNDCQINHWNP